ncbi:MAG TPA: protein-disulfide reductase DsbD domain-containing protein [Pyrinomonadaceae bacterium]
MRRQLFAIQASIILLLGATIQAAPPVTTTPAPPTRAYTAAATPAQPGIDVSGLFSVNKAQPGSVLQGAVILRIPDGYHINSNRPTNKFMIPTSVRVFPPRGVRVGPVRYPRANVRSFGFAPDERLPVFEGAPAMRFDVTVPAGFKQDKLRMRVVVAYQACSDETCFRPAERDITLSLDVAGADEEVQRVNGHIFGRGRRR